MEILLSKELGYLMPKTFFEKVNFDLGNLDKEDWQELSHQNNDGYWEAWDKIFHDFEYHADDGCYYLCYDREGNLCLATEREIEITVVEI